MFIAFYIQYEKWGVAIIKRESKFSEWEQYLYVETAEPKPRRSLVLFICC